MASQVAHIVYAKKYFEECSLSPEEKEVFMLGCVFPDIRRIDNTIRRRDTHLRFSPLNLNFENLTPFEAGWKFHLYCDMRREEILNAHDFYSLKYTEKFYNHPAKMLEDEVVYDRCDDWKKIAQYFNAVSSFSTGLDLAPGIAELWYSILANYIDEKPTSDSIKTFLLKQPALAPAANDIVATVDKLRKNDTVIEILKRVPEEIITG